MKIKKALLYILCILFVVASAGPTPLYAKSSKKKIERIDKDIQMQEGRKGHGLLLGGLGLGIGVLSSVIAWTVVYNSNYYSIGNDANTATIISLAGGTVGCGFLIFGGWEFFDASGQLSQLKAKRYDLDEGMLNFRDNELVLSIPKFQLSKNQVSTTLAKATF